MCPTIVPLMRETKKEQDIYFTSLIETMKILVATEKPFAKKAVDGIRKIVEDAGYELDRKSTRLNSSHPSSSRMPSSA